MFESQSALYGALQAHGRDGVAGRRGLRMGEATGWQLTQVAAFAATLPVAERAVRSVIETELPLHIGEVTTAGGRRLLKTGPEQFWIVSQDDADLAASLQASVAAAIGTVTQLSHSRTLIFVDGPQAREMLAQGVAVDLHPAVFRLNQFALTGLHHTPVLLHRVGEIRYELYVMRTFARSVWEWLTDAALPFGYDVTLEPVTLTSGHSGQRGS